MHVYDRAGTLSLSWESDGKVRLWDNQLFSFLSDSVFFGSSCKLLCNAGRILCHRRDLSDAAAFKDLEAGILLRGGHLSVCRTYRGSGRKGCASGSISHIGAELLVCVGLYGVSISDAFSWNDGGSADQEAVPVSAPVAGAFSERQSYVFPSGYLWHIYRTGSALVCLPGASGRVYKASYRGESNIFLVWTSGVCSGFSGGAGQCLFVGGAASGRYGVFSELSLSAGAFSHGFFVS